MTVPVPPKLRDELCAWEPSAVEWLGSIPSIVDALVDAWSLDEVGAPFESTLAWVAPVGATHVLKVAWPHGEGRDEALALRVWDGEGAVGVVRHDADRWAMLLERCAPGSPLGERWTAATVPIGCELLRRLWVATDEPFQELESVIAPWAEITLERAARRPELLDAGVVELGCALLESLPSGARHLLHGDFHPGNVLSSARQPWLAIDPKPIVGDREWDAVMLLVHGVIDESALRERLATVTDLLGVSRTRLCGFALARVVEWVFWDAEVASDEDAAALHATQARLLAGFL
jgi:streptomycin 6-kinase